MWSQQEQRTGRHMYLLCWLYIMVRMVLCWRRIVLDFVLLNLGTYFIMDIITNRFTLCASFGPRPGLCLISPDAYIFRKYMPNLTQQEFVEQSHVMLLPRLHFQLFFKLNVFSWTSVVLLFFAWGFLLLLLLLLLLGWGVAANANEDRRNDLFREWLPPSKWNKWKCPFSWVSLKTWLSPRACI